MNSRLKPAALQGRRRMSFASEAYPTSIPASGGWRIGERCRKGTTGHAAAPFQSRLVEPSAKMLNGRLGHRAVLGNGG